MFKSYTRKSSALVGAERAGLLASAVVQHEGKWGFWVKNEPVAAEEQKTSNVVVLRPRTTLSNALHAALTPQPKLGDRRKVLRGVYRALKELRVHNRSSNVHFHNGFLRESAQRLRQSYRCADIARV